MTGILINLVVSGASLILFVAPPHEDYDTLVDEYQKALKEYARALKAAPEARSKPGARLPHPPHPSKAFLPRFKSYVLANRTNPEAAFKGLRVLFEIANSYSESQNGKSVINPFATWATKLLTTDYAAHPGVMDVAGRVSVGGQQVPWSDIVRLFETIIAQNQDRQAIAMARFNLAKTLRDGDPDAEVPENRRADEKRRAEALFREVATSYADTRAGGLAKREVFEIEHLQVGMLAPDFEGKDVDGKTIRLSQFRGNVVVIVFWGPYWSSEGRSFPAERELVGRFSGRPFVLLGVNNYANTRSELRKTLEKEAITWPNILDLGGEPNNIARQWNVRGWPSNYVLDHTGVIRGRNTHGKQLHAMVEELTAAVPR